jgi:hypothetical protein
MKHKGFLIFATAIFSLLAPGASVAQLNDPCGCNAGLAREVRRYERNSRISLAYLQQIDEKQYEKIKRDGNADAVR